MSPYLSEMQPLQVADSTIVSAATYSVAHR